MTAILESERLCLRAFTDEDREPFAAMNADPEVMEFFPKLHQRQDSDNLIERINREIDLEGFGIFAAELKESSEFIGFVGLSRPDYPLPCGPCVEVGWRLAKPFWGRGLASEGARVCLAFAFDALGLDEVVSFTFEGNFRSQAVMERIGMRRDPSCDFLHPKLAPDNWLARHVFYRIGAPQA